MAIRKELRVRRPKKDKKTHYVDNEKLFLVIKDYKQRCKDAEAAGTQLPTMPEYIGVAAWKIAENYANNYSYRGYLFREDLIADGALFCIKSVSSFNPDKYDNPFTYFTTAVQFGFWQRIEREKKYQYTKFKMIDKASIYNEMYEGDSHNSVSADMPYSDNSIVTMRNFIKDYEESLAKKKQISLDKKMISDSDATMGEEEESEE
jgi:hypothetical protein